MLARGLRANSGDANLALPCLGLIFDAGYRTGQGKCIHRALIAGWGCSSVKQTRTSSACVSIAEKDLTRARHWKFGRLVG